MDAEPSVRAIPLPDLGGDERGSSFPLALDSLVPALDEAFGPPFRLRDAHVATLRPGAVRGNHYHARRVEILLVLPGARWSLWWDGGEGTETQTQAFEGSEPVAVFLAPMCSHAVRNDDSCEMLIVGLSDIDYDPGDPDVFPRALV